MCLSAGISPERAIYTKFFVHVAYCCSSVLLRRDDKIQMRRDNFWGFLPIDNALYSITFGTHTKTAKPIEMQFEIKTRAQGTMY